MSVSKAVLSGYGESDGVANAVLVIEDEDSTEAGNEADPNDPGKAKKQKLSEGNDKMIIEILVIKEILMYQSPVFRKMFTSPFKEASAGRVELPGKPLGTVLLMLDHLYPTKTLVLNDSTATNLLPLAHEYEIEQLKNLCILELEKFANARLEYVSLAIRYSLDDLLTKAIKSCAMKLSLTNIDRQRLQAENHEIDDSIVLQILRRKTELTRDFHGTLRNQLSNIFSGCMNGFGSSTLGSTVTSDVNDYCDFNCKGRSTRNLRPKREVEGVLNKLKSDCPRL